MTLRPPRSADLSRGSFHRRILPHGFRRAPAACHGSVSLSELKREKFILYKNPGHNTRELTIQYCWNAGFEPDVTFETEQAETIQYLVPSTLGGTLRCCGIT